VSNNSCAGDRFVIFFSSGLDTCAQVITGSLSAFDTNSNNDNSNNNRVGDSPAISQVPVIFGESCERLGRPAEEGDGVSGTGARVMSVSEWVGVYGECAESLLCAWVFSG
ncbi:unnamed protein product, partial [Hapterophycus canaliculatus]